MNTKLALATLIAVLAGCGQQPMDHFTRVQPAPFKYSLEAEFVPYYERFTDVYNVNTKFVAGWFADTYTNSGGNAVGICYSYTDGSRRIEIDRDYWNASSDLGKEQLMFHELGHCVFNLDHNETTIDLQNYGTIPASIMWPYTFGENWYYSELKDYYLKELKP